MVSRLAALFPMTAPGTLTVRVLVKGIRAPSDGPRVYERHSLGTLRGCHASVAPAWHKNLGRSKRNAVVQVVGAPWREAVSVKIEAYKAHDGCTLASFFEGP